MYWYTSVKSVQKHERSTGRSISWMVFLYRLLTPDGGTQLQAGQRDFLQWSKLRLGHDKGNFVMSVLEGDSKIRNGAIRELVRSRLTYSCQNWNLNQVQFDRLDVCYRRFLRRMIRGGFKRKSDSENEFSLKINNNKLHQLCGTRDVNQFIKEQQCNYAGHIVRTSSDRATKKLMFNSDRYTKAGRTTPTLLEQAATNRNSTVDGFCNYAMARTRK
jgi:hypothetical protein